MNAINSSVNEREIAHFSSDADKWWDEKGPFAPLHKLNPQRMHYIKDQICNHFELDFKNIKALKGLDIVDIGCGGGLVCEPLARMGSSVTGLDADPVAIDVAKKHASENNLKIKYQNLPAEHYTDKFDVVLALEIIEHVNDPAGFVKSCAQLLKPGGLVIFSTLNRTPKSFALGIVAAEYLLRWVPRGTHNWKQFVKPSELARYVRNASLKPTDISGLTYNPITSEFRLSKNDIEVNYFLSASNKF